MRSPSAPWRWSVVGLGALGYLAFASLTPRVDPAASRGEGFRSASMVAAAAAYLLLLGRHFAAFGYRLPGEF